MKNLLKMFGEKIGNQKYGAYYPHTLLIKNQQGKAFNLAGKFYECLDKFVKKRMDYLQEFYKNEIYNTVGGCK